MDRELFDSRAFERQYLNQPVQDLHDGYGVPYRAGHYCVPDLHSHGKLRPALWRIARASPTTTALQFEHVDNPAWHLPLTPELCSSLRVVQLSENFSPERFPVWYRAFHQAGVVVWAEDRRPEKRGVLRAVWPDGPPEMKQAEFSFALDDVGGYPRWELNCLEYFREQLVLAGCPIPPVVDIWNRFGPGR